MTPPPNKRPGTQDRDVYIEKHPTPTAGTPVHVDDECTGKHEGDELRSMRARRPTPERISRLEDKHDGLESKVDRIEGKLDTLSEFLGVKTAEDGKTQRARISTNGRVMIGIVVAAITTIGTVLVAVLK